MSAQEKPDPLAAGRASDTFCFERPNSRPSSIDLEARAAADWFAARLRIPQPLARVLGALASLRSAIHVRAALQWLHRGALQEHGDLLASLGVSLREAAYQGRDSLARAHLGEARLVLIEAIRVFKELEELNRRDGA